MELELGVWLTLSIFASQPSMLANCSLVLFLQWSFDYEQVEEVGLVVEAFSQLGSLSTVMILGLEIGEAIWPGWIVLDGDLEGDWSLWWICLECYRVFGR